jgi:Protein of unknown function (DUF3383)
MALSDIVQVNITATSAFPSLPNFGEPLIAAVTSAFTPLTMEFSSLSAMVTQGFLVTDPAYLAASKIWSQNPSVPAIKVGRRALSYTQTLTLTALSAVTGVVYNLSVGGKAVTYTVPGASTTTTVATAITSLITALALSGVVATSSAAIITLTQTAGVLVDVVQDFQHMSFADITADPGIATDLAAILVFDSNWYGLILDSNSKAEVVAAAAWVEANPAKLFITNGSDTAVSAGTGGNTLKTLKAAAYSRTAYLHSQSQLLSYSGAAWMGKQFTATPGSDNWAFKTLAGVTVDNLSDAQIHQIENDNGNVYTAVAGVNITQFGVLPSGQWIDVQRGLDWFAATMQTNIFGVLANNSKIPYTDAGMDVLRSTILGVFQTAINNGFLAATPAPILNIPLVANQSPTDRGARRVNNITFSANLAGAVNKLVISGTVSV